MVTDQDIRALADRIVAEFHPEKIILFGSRAHGTPRFDSDIDILVVLPVDGPRFRMAGKIRASLPDTLSIDVVVRSPDDVRAGRSLGDPLTLEALRSGIVLYQAAA